MSVCSSEYKPKQTNVSWTGMKNHKTESPDESFHKCENGYLSGCTQIGSNSKKWSYDYIGISHGYLSGWLYAFIRALQIVIGRETSNDVQTRVGPQNSR